MLLLDLPLITIRRAVNERRLVRLPENTSQVRRLDDSEISLRADEFPQINIEYAKISRTAASAGSDLTSGVHSYRWR